MSKIITCEQVSNGHPDKICDQIADAIVTDILQHDRHARVAIECLLKKSQLFIAGEVTTDYRPNYNQIVHDVFNRIGAEKLGWNLTELLRIGILVDKQSPDIALGVDKGGAGDQGIMYGYATNETAEQMPIPYMVATKFLQLLKAHPSRMFRADAKAQVSYDYDTGRITTFLCSVQHSPDVEVSDFRHIIESMMVLAACEYGLDGNFQKLVNPTGRFVLGGSFADCGVTGRKLACDTYGGIGRMGGGALSGKDPTKVDRSAAYMARKIAKDIVQAGYADKAQLVIADIPYNIGTDFYASRPDWYVDGDNKNGESDKARKAAFNTDFTFNIAEYFHFCNRLLKKEPGKGEKDAPCMIVFCAFQQIPKVIAEAEKYGFKNYIPLVFCKNYSPQVLKANMKIVGATEYALVLYRNKLPKFRNLGADGKTHMIFNWFDWKRDGKEYPKIHPSQKPVSVLKRLIETFSDEGDVVIDPCAGSGSTLRAARELGRNSYGFEVSRDFYRKATEQMLGEEAV